MNRTLEGLSERRDARVFDVPDDADDDVVVARAWVRVGCSWICLHAVSRTGRFALANDTDGPNLGHLTDLSTTVCVVQKRREVSCR